MAKCHLRLNSSMLHELLPEVSSRIRLAIIWIMPVWTSTTDNGSSSQLAAAVIGEPATAVNTINYLQFE